MPRTNAIQDRHRYAYDVFNRQIRKSVSQNQNTRTRVTRYGWDGERMCAEVKEGLTRTTIYEPGSHVPLLRIDQEEQSPDPVPNLDLAPGVQRLFAPPRPNPPARIAHYHTDHLGTPLMLTGQEGKVLWWATPDDWSAVRDEKGETDQPIRFQGQQLDEESGLHYNFNRYYDPSIGRYVTQDPIGLEGGINAYAYVNGNPLSSTDPNGLNPLAAAGAEGGFVVGGPIGAVVGGVIGFGAGLYIGSQIMESRSKSDPVVLPPVNPGRDCHGKCLPCPKGAKWWVPKPGHGHSEGYWHTIVYNQDLRTCKCYPDRPSQGLQGK